jgi:MFS family permease
MSPAPDRKPRLWTRNFSLLTISLVLISTAFYILMPTLPVYLQEELNVGKSQVGIIMAMYTLAAVISRPFTGYILDTFGRKVLFLSTISLFSLIFLLYPLTLLLFPILLIRFLHGLNWGAATTSGFTLVVDFVPYEMRGRGIGYFGLSFTVAMSIGPVLGIKLMHGGNYDLVFMVASAVAILGAMAAFLLKYPAFSRPEKRKFSVSQLIAKPSLPVSVNMMILAATNGGVVTFVALYAGEIGLKDLTGWFFVVMAIGTTLTRIFSGRLFDKYGPTWISVFGMLAVSGGMMLLSQMPIPFGFLTAGFTVGVGFGVIFPTLQTMANNVVHRDRRGAANSTFLTGLDMGIGIGAVISGAVSGKLGLSWVYEASSLLALGGLLFFLLFSLPHYTRYRTED